MKLHLGNSALTAAWLVVAPFAAQAAESSTPAQAAAPTITSFTPTSGPLGTRITVNGTNFGGATLVAIGGTPASFSLSSATKLTATLPATASGAIAVTTPGGTGTSSTFTVTPGLVLSTATGRESQGITITGAGFAPYNSIDVYFDATDVALAVSNNLGVVSIAIQIPATAQPGTHWITLDSRASHIAAQSQFLVNTNWSMQGFSANGLGSNPYENTLTTSNVAGLTTAWTQPSGGYGNPSPFIEANGNLYVGDVLGDIYAYSGTGALLWHAQPSGADFQSVSPAASASLVYFASGTTVYAYPLSCHVNGALCTPTWTITITASASAGLTLFQGTLYVPASDGYIHPVNPTTGVAGTPFTAFGANGTPVTSQVSFDFGGGYYFAQGNVFAYRTNVGASGTYNYAAAVSTPAVSQGHLYFTTADGMVHEFGGWSAATSGTGCAPQPAVANDLVFAGGCTSITAYEAGQGTEYWSVTTPGQVVGLSVANGVLYGCVYTNYNGQLFAYAASYGGLLWSGGACTGAPVIANGAVYGALGTISAHTLPGISPTYASRRPAPSTLTPNVSLRPQHTPDSAAAQ
jgi:hypothetical protein